MWNGLKVIISPLAVTKVPAFPASRHRSKRILKKLIKRHGGMTKDKPAGYQIGNTLVIHPVLWEQLKNDNRAKRFVVAENHYSPIPGIGDHADIRPAPKLDGDPAGLSPAG
jgi:hypothetical protein